jgi:hypothetical protein
MDIQASIDVLLSSSPDQFTEKLSVVRQKALEFIPFADEVRRPGRYTTSVDLMKAVRRILAVRKKVFGEEADFDESDKSAANLLEDSKSFSLHDQHLCSLPRFIDRVLEFHQRNPELARACWTTVYPERGDATNYAADISLVDASMVREHVHADYPQVIYGVLSRNVDRPFIADYVGIFKFISPDRTEFMNAVTSQDYIDRLSGLPTETAKTYLGLFHAYMRKAGDRLITYDVFDPTKQEGRTVMRAVEETPHILDPLAGRGASSEDKELIVGYLQSLTVPEYLSALRAVAQKPYTNAYVDLFVMSAQKIKDADGYSEFKRVASSEGFVGFLDSVEQRAAGAASAYIGLLDDESTALTLMSNPLRTILTASPEAVGSLRTLRENKCLTAVLPHMVIEEYAGFFTGQRLSTLARWSTNANQWKAAEAALRYLRDGDRLRAGLVLSISDEHAGNVEQVGSILRTLNETPDQFLDGAEGGLTGINRARERHYRERGIPAERRERIINEALRVMNPQVVDAFKRLCAHAPKLMPSPSEGKGFAENFAKNWREVPADLTIQIINQLIEKARGTQQSG